MISPNFYDKAKGVRQLLGATASHYAQKNRTVVLEKYLYTLKEGETIYTLALKVFGAEGVYNWSIIADINQLKEISEWKPGERIFLPRIILNDPEILTQSYDAASSLSTPIQY